VSALAARPCDTAAVDRHDPAAFNDPAAWDARYSGGDQLWSGNPNQALVTEVRGLPPSRALDVGCGEGADAIWLAQQGWEVTALDVSQVALERAAAAAQERDVEVRWLHVGLLEAPLDPEGFDLVSAQYFALPRTSDAVAEHALLNAVRPGGTLLVVHHAEFGAHASSEPGFDPALFLAVEDVHAVLGEEWTIEVYEQRKRDVRSGAGAHHNSDVVLRASRSRSRLS
jgi:SAM-dependent methyltransferase